jgi:hypothetical protein
VPRIGVHREKEKRVPRTYEHLVYKILASLPLLLLLLVDQDPVVVIHAMTIIGVIDSSR